MASLTLKNVYKEYDNGKKALSDFSIDIAQKEFVVIVGPSGCGKTTLLRLVAGLSKATGGEILMDGVVVNNVKPKDRSVTLVFQNYALFPYMTAYDNIAFGLKIAGMDKKEIDVKVKEAAKILGIESELSSKPRELSGGQCQRVALGRAMVSNPKFFLLDEPLSNLDAKLRAEMRAQITELYEKLDATFIYVTHDQVEAMTMGTRIAVIDGGVLQQFDTPRRVYEHPANKFVASFIGSPEMNLLDSVLKKEGDKVRLTTCRQKLYLPLEMFEGVEEKFLSGNIGVTIGIRPEDIIILPKTTDAQNLKVNVKNSEFLGNQMLVHAMLGGETITIKTTEQVTKGKLAITFDINKLHFFSAKSGRNIR
ncbi:MAG: ATP-binding cassette domain-containing protein [Clostridiales bacterium]|nr:ATP-binding cassette domain-containing protein [Clostridiales bacterium]